MSAIHRRSDTLFGGGAVGRNRKLKPHLDCPGCDRCKTLRGPRVHPHCKNGVRSESLIGRLLGNVPDLHRSQSSFPEVFCGWQLVEQSVICPDLLGKTLSPHGCMQVFVILPRRGMQLHASYEPSHCFSPPNPAAAENATQHFQASQSPRVAPRPIAELKCGPICGPKKTRTLTCCIDNIFSRHLAERVGFEPTVPAKAQRFSRPPRSATLAPLQARWRRIIPAGQGSPQPSANPTQATPPHPRTDSPH